MPSKEVVFRGIIEWDEDIPIPVTITISPVTLPELQVGRAVDITFIASGGTVPYTFTATNLPPGLTITPQGQLTGIPETEGDYFISVLAVDANQDSGGQSYTGTIKPEEVIVVSDTLTKANFEYLGCAKIDKWNAALFSFAYGGIAGRKVNGKTRLFMAINEVNYHGSILEFEMPDAPLSKDYKVAPEMYRVRWWGDVYGGRRGTYMSVADAEKSVKGLKDRLAEEINPDIIALLKEKIKSLNQWINSRGKKAKSYEYYEFPVGQSCIGCLLWDEPNRRLLWTYYDNYNVSGRPDWALGASFLNDDVPESDPESFKAYGPWRIACPTGGGYTSYGAWRGGGLCIRQSTGELVTSGSIMSGNAGSPWGNDAHGGGSLPANNHPWNVDLVQPKRYLDHYYMGGLIGQDGRLLEGVPLKSQKRKRFLPFWENFGGGIVLNINNEIYGYDSWRQVDGSGLCLWFDDLDGKSGLIYIGTSAVEHEWYATTANNHACPNHQVPEPVTVTGPVSTRSVAMMWIYNVEDMERVIRGELQDYEPEEINLTDEFGLHGSWPNVMAGNNAIAGTYFDKEEKKLYLMSPRSDDVTVPPELGPVVHVLQIK